MSSIIRVFKLGVFAKMQKYAVQGVVDSKGHPTRCMRTRGSRGSRVRVLNHWQQAYFCAFVQNTNHSLRHLIYTEQLRLKWRSEISWIYLIYRLDNPLGGLLCRNSEFCHWSIYNREKHGKASKKVDEVEVSKSWLLGWSLCSKKKR